MMRTLRKASLYLLMAALLCLLTACGFRLGAATDIPAARRTLYWDASQPYSELAKQTRAFLQTMGITWVKEASQAPYTLQLSDLQWSESHPNITNTQAALIVTYSVSATIALTDRHGKLLLPKKRIEASRNILQNTHQVYVPELNALAQHALERDFSRQVYYFIVLSTGNVHEITSATRAQIGSRFGRLD